MKDAVYASTSTKLLEYDVNRIRKHDRLSDAAKGHPITVHRNQTGQRQQANEINASNRRCNVSFQNHFGPDRLLLGMTDTTGAMSVLI